MNNLIFVDVEANGRCPGKGIMTEFGAVTYPARQSFHGVLAESYPDPLNPAMSKLVMAEGYFDQTLARQVMNKFSKWIYEQVGTQRPILVSDNPAYDFQWINYYFWHYGDPEIGNPFGHSARRISDFYAGLMGDFHNTQSWKKLRVTRHDHNPVHDALGNVEAFQRLLDGER